MEVLKQIHRDMELLEQSDLTVSELDNLLLKYVKLVGKEKLERASDECCIVNKETLDKMIYEFVFRVENNKPTLKMEPSEIISMFKNLEDTFSEFYYYNYNEYAPKFSNITSNDVYKVLEVLCDKING